MNVIVIGAGVIGLSCADALAAAGHRVHALDMRGPGRGASQASAGVLAPFIEGHHGDPLLDLCIESLSLYDAFIESVRVTSGRSVEYERTGTLEVAVTETDKERLINIHRSLRELHVEAEWLDGIEAHTADAAISRAALGALRIPAHGFVNVSELIAALAQSARFRGASIEVPASVIRVEPTKQRVGVVLDGQIRECDAVVIAAGSWSSRVRVAGLPPIEVKPIRGQLLHLSWPADEQLPKQVIWADRCYAVPWADRSLLVGATVEDVGFKEHSTVEGVRGLMDAVGEILPAALQASLKEVRVGLRPAPSGGVPFIGPVATSPRVILATGHYRNGVMLAPLTAKRVVEHVGMVSH